MVVTLSTTIINRAEGSLRPMGRQEIVKNLKLSVKQAKQGKTISANSAREMVRAKYGL